MDDLTFVPTEALLVELYSRYDVAVFAGLRDLTSDELETECSHAGGVVPAVGLVAFADTYLRKRMTEAA